MTVERCCRAIAALLLAAAFVPFVRAGSPPARHPARPPVPLPLLEFLGAHATTSRAHKADGSRWLEYLSRINLSKPAHGAKALVTAKSKPAHGSSGMKKERGR